MVDFQQKKQFKKIIYSKISFVVLFILIIFLARSTYDIYKKYRVSLNEYNSTKRDYDSLIARKNMLDSEISRLKTENGIEEEIRNKFNVAKPNETVVIVIDNDSSSTETDNSKKSFWSKIWSIF